MWPPSWCCVTRTPPVWALPPRASSRTPGQQSALTLGQTCTPRTEDWRVLLPGRSACKWMSDEAALSVFLSSFLLAFLLCLEPSNSPPSLDTTTHFLVVVISLLLPSPHFQCPISEGHPTIIVKHQVLTFPLLQQQAFVVVVGRTGITKLPRIHEAQPRRSDMT